MEGLTGGSRADGGTPPSDATTLDGFTADGGGDSADAGRPFDCTGDAHWICDDFDRDGQSLDATWSISNNSGTVTVEAIDPTTPSPPSSLVMELMPDASEMLALYQSYNRASSGGVRCSVSFRVASAPRQGFFVLHADLSAGNGELLNYFFDVVVDNAPPTPLLGFSDYATMADGASGSGPSHDLGPLQPGWNTLELTLRGGGNGGISAALNGAPVTLTGPFAADLSTSAQYQFTNVRLGPATGDNPTSVKVLYDNVVCDLL